MVRHVVIWDLKEGYSDGEKQAIRNKIKAGLEALKGVIPEIKELTVVAELLPASTGGAMLDSLFEDEAALQRYQKHPEHLKMREYIHTVIAGRRCIDYTV